MKTNLNNIDGVFKDQLRNYTQTAPDGVWENIEQTLNGFRKAKRRLIYKVAASIAALAVIGSGYYFINKNNNEITNNEVIAQQNKEIVTNDPAKAKMEVPQNTNKIQEELKEEKSKENSLLIARTENNDNAQSIENEIIDNIEVKNDFVKDRSLKKLDQKQILISEQKVELAIVDDLKREEKPDIYNLPDNFNIYALEENPENKGSQKSKWMIGGEFTPLYSYRHISSTEQYSKDYYNTAENATMTYTGGLNVQYKALGKLTVQAGVYYTKMGQSLDYMSVYANKAYEMVADEYKDRFINSYSINNSSGEISFNTPYLVVDDKLTRVNNLSDNKFGVDKSDPVFYDLNGELLQSFQYIEVPVIARYKLIDRNIDVNIIGGFGANFLIGNDVIIKYADSKEVVGETKGVNTINYNGTIGFGIDYPLMDRLNIRLEPSIKYYLNEINPNSTVESHPYSIGIYTGINYSF